MDFDDNILGYEERLLINATDISLQDVPLCWPYMAELQYLRISTDHLFRSYRTWDTSTVRWVLERLRFPVAATLAFSWRTIPSWITCHTIKTRMHTTSTQCLLQKTDSSLLKLLLRKSLIYSKGEMCQTGLNKLSRKTGNLLYVHI